MSFQKVKGLFDEERYELLLAIDLASERAKRFEEFCRRRVIVGHRRALARREMERSIVAYANRCALNKHEDLDEASAIITGSPLTALGGSTYGTIFPHLNCEARICPENDKEEENIYYFVVTPPPSASASSYSSGSILTR